MATLQDDIILTVIQAKDYAACMADNFISREANGDVVDRCCEMKMMLLIRWIDIMEDYYCENFGVNGNITPNIACLTLAQAQELLAKIKAFIGV